MLLGVQIYHLIRNLLSHKKAGDKTFQEFSGFMVKSLLKSNVSRGLNLLLAQGHLLEESQRMLQSYENDWLRKKNLLQIMWDWLVCRISNDRIKRWLSSETDLTFKNANWHRRWNWLNGNVQGFQVRPAIMTACRGIVRGSLGFQEKCF